MAGRTSTQRASLEKQNAAIMAVFNRAGFAQIAPDIIQPADIFLERSGEDIRARTFVFSDPDGTELCLRPDLTVPACRFHLSHAKQPEKEAKYSYLGTAFRFPNEKLSPQEFTQVGLEWFGAKDSIGVEARMLKLAVAAVKAAGARSVKITIGDVGLFAALLNDTPMPDRWRRRLQHQFWRPEAFRDLLTAFAGGQVKNRSSISHVVDALNDQPPDEFISSWLQQNAQLQQGNRSFAEVAQRLAEKLADRSEAALPPASVAQIERHLKLSASAETATTKLSKVAAGENYRAALTTFAKRLTAFNAQGLDVSLMKFSASFGREIEYYTGFVFQLEVNGVVVAGGGRYDDMLSDLGAKKRIPAFGFAIHAERLQAALQ